MSAGSMEAVSPKMQSTIAEVVKKHAECEQLQWVSDATKMTVEMGRHADRYDVYRVHSDGDNSKSVVVKHFTGAETAGRRGEIEFQALLKFENLAPGSVIKPVFFDKDTHLLCMEDLKDHVIYRSSLIDANFDEDAAFKLAKDVAVVHRETHTAKIGQDALSVLDTKFRNEASLSNRANLLFTAPFTRDDPTNRCSEAVKARLDWLYGDDEVMRAASNMKKVFLEKKDALVHGDLHTGSIMVCGKDARMIDTEFSYVGPCSLDLGVLIANFIFNYYCHLLNPVDNDERRVFAYRVVEMSSETVHRYFQHMTSVTGDAEEYQARVMSEVAGFAGCEIVRRLVGSDHVADLEDRGEVDVLGAGVRLLKAYHRIHSIGTLMLIALMLA